MFHTNGQLKVKGNFKDGEKDDIWETFDENGNLTKHIFGKFVNAAEGDYFPIIRIPPLYPARALSRGMEGYVDMAFTVTTIGKVRNPVVLFSTSSLFERATIEAVLKFEYKPRIVDGIPIEVPNTKTKITFKIEY